MSLLKKFPKKKVGFDEDSYGFAINHPVFKKTQPGDVGIEIEMEGSRFTGCPVNINGVYWVTHNDGSLRGEGAREYVLSAPCKIEDVSPLLDGLYDHFKASKARYQESTRTSVHVHLNVQGLKINQLCSLISLWGIFEDTLVNWCGEYRVGNLFCLRLRDCEWAIGQLATMFRLGNFGLLRENSRYLAMNPVALTKFNSLEIRSLRGTDDPELIKTWVSILWKIYEAAKAYTNPEDIARDFSGLGGVGFMEKIIGREHAMMIARYNDELGANPEDLIWEGLRRMQPIIFSLPWGQLQQRLNQIAIPNPFGIKAKKARINLGAWVPAPMDHGADNRIEEDDD